MRLTFLPLALVASILFTPVVHAGVKASSFMIVSGKPESTYGPANLIDGDPGTVWIEGKEGAGLQESFQLDLPRSEVKKLVLIPGHSADERMFKKYAHLKEVVLTFSTIDNNRNLKEVKSVPFTFEDAFKPQEVPVPGVKLGDELFGGQLKVTIKSVFPGVDFQDTAVGDVKVVLDEYPAQLEVAESAPALKGFGAENLIDANPKTAWVAEQSTGSSSLSFNAPDYGLVAVVISTGVQKDPAKFKEYARPKDITITVDAHVVKHTLKDAPGAQRIDLPVINGYTGALFGVVKISIDSVYPGTKAQNPALGEVQLLATNLAL